MYQDDPLQGLPTRLDAFGRKVADESRMTIHQRIQWERIKKDRHPSQMKGYQEEPIKPWRGISTETLPTDLKNQLKPHWRDWVVVNPEYARYRESADDIRVFVMESKGARRVQSLSAIGIAQQRYALRRQISRRTGMGGGGPAAAANQPEADPVEQEVPRLRRSYVRIEKPINHTRFKAGKAPLQGDGPYTLKVDGTYSNGDGLVLHWENLDTGMKGQSPVESYPNRVGEPWKTELAGLRPGSQRITIRNAQGDSHHIRIEIRPETIPVAEILYETGANTFHLIPEEDYAAFQQELEEFDAVIRQLEQAHQGQSEDQLKAARASVDQKLTGLVSTGGESSLLTEVIGFRGKKFTYVRSDKVANHWRSYKVDEDMKRRSLCGPDGKLDIKKLKEEFKTGSKTSFKWDLIEPHGGSFNQWAARFNQTATKILLPKDDPQRNFDASMQAQMLRYAYGASLKGNFGFGDKTFGVKLEGGGDFAVAEGKVNLNAYYPTAQGHNIAFDYTVKNNTRGNAGQVKHFDLGRMRTKAEVCLFGFAGASCQASGGVYFEYQPGEEDNPGKMQLRGSRKGDEGFAGIGGEAFAGVKVGGEIIGNGEWQNPEKNKEWAALMSVGAEGSVAAGGGLEGDLSITYYNGKFRIRAKAALVWGVGAGGGFLFSVNVDTIAEFCMFIYHQLKNNDFNFLDLVHPQAFEYYDFLSSYVLLVGKPLRVAYEKGEEFIVDMKNAVNDVLEILENAKTHLEAAKAVVDRILANPDLVLFLTPEGKGRLLRNLCYEEDWSKYQTFRENAMMTVLKSLQTGNEFKEVMEHHTGDGRRLLLKPKGIEDDKTWQRGMETLRDFLEKVQELKEDYQRLQRFLERFNQLPKPQLNAKAIRDNGIANV
jgi:hypothetical protein